MQQRILILAVIVLAIQCLEAGSKKRQMLGEPIQVGRNIDLNELKKNFIGKLYAASGASVPSHLSKLQVIIFFKNELNKIPLKSPFLTIIFFCHTIEWLRTAKIKQKL